MSLTLGYTTQLRPTSPHPSCSRSYKGSVSFISFFNHKGGVAKTTSAYSIAWGLAAKGAKVILFDLDSQCNLTQYALNSRVQASKHTWSTFYAQLPVVGTVSKALQQAMAGLAPVYAHPLAHFPAPAGSAGTVRSRVGELRIVCGDEQIMEFEERMAKAAFLMVADKDNDHGRIVGAQWHLALMTACAYKADVVIFDCSPSLSILNKVTLMTSDFAIFPCGPDYFSKMALESLERRIVSGGGGGNNAFGGGMPTQVFLDAVKELRSQARADCLYPLPEPKVISAGIIISKFNNRGSRPNGEIIAGAAIEYLKGEAEDAADSLHETLRISGHALTVNEMIALGYPAAHDTTLFNLQDYAGLAAFGSKLGIPVPFLQMDVIDRLCEWSSRVCNDYYHCDTSL